MNALNAYNRLNANVAGMKKASEKLSSGYRINRAGDDAAGLAISEKMRSQIKGLNQAIRNSQDGINMIQTFEGAAQETHSILQRMKELATESANGTYDNATDRAAIQLEFEQLNDELNQIADTDFNGTIVLNGGVMADGLEAKMGTNGIGEFNYKEQYDATHDADGNLISSTGKDIVGGYAISEDKDTPTNEAAHKILDNTKYDQAKSEALWKELGLDSSKVSEVNITFAKGEDGSWTGILVTDKDGNILKDANAAVKTEATANGGFKVSSAEVNAIFNDFDAKAGDYITLNFTAVSEKTYAPTNAGIDEVGDTGHAVDINLTGANADDVDVTMPTFTLDEGITDDAMTQDIADGLDALNKAVITATVAADAADPTKVSVTYTFDATTDAKLTVDADGVVAWDGTTLGKLEGGNVVPKGETTTTYTKLANDTWTDGTKQAVAAGDITNNLGADITGSATANDKITVNGGAVTGTYGGGAAPAGVQSTLDDGVYFYDGTDWYKAIDDAAVEAAGATAADIAAATVGGTLDVTTQADFVDGAAFDFGVNIDSYNYASGDVEAHAVATNTKLADAIKEASEKAGVTKANAFDNSTAIMTYTENITLQTGSRTKDAVNFSFKYNTDGTADMGDLIANLDLSARANGLNTANLSLANQDDANYAIDQIDKAINKTSMVRATFGAIQNRLEHKITNLTTTSENLQEAESSIRDTDMASEMMNYTKYNILQQAAQSMLAQANQQPQSILQLLG